METTVGSAVFTLMKTIKVFVNKRLSFRMTTSVSCCQDQRMTNLRMVGSDGLNLIIFTKIVFTLIKGIFG